MENIIEVKSIIKRADVISVLAESVYMPNENKLNKRAETYIENENIIAYGYELNNIICGLIVIDIENVDEILILDIAVDKTQQRKGIGKKLINYVLYNCNPKVLVAETDNDAVDFYSKCGFQATNLGEKYPGVCRYECKYFSTTN